MPIICADFFKQCKNISSDSVDLILTDPPYGINYRNGLSKKQKNIKIMNDGIDEIDWNIFFEECYRILKDRKTLYIFGRTDMFLRIAKFIIESQFRYVHDFIWFKGDMGYGNLNVMGTTHEMIICFSKNSPEKSRIVNGKKRVPAYYKGKVSTKEYVGHPVQKPIELLKYIILNRTDENDIILDPFAGVGSVEIAAKQLNRKCISCEIEQKWVDIAIKRINETAKCN